MPTPPDRPTFDDLGPADRDLLESFESPGTSRKAWTVVVREMIWPGLADALDRGDADAIGLWHGGRLVAITGWIAHVDRPEIWTSIILAVQVGCQGRGYGLGTKLELLRRADDRDVSVVRSTVHFDNDPMIELNRRLGATIERTTDRDHLECVIPVRSGTWRNVSDPLEAMRGDGI